MSDFNIYQYIRIDDQSITPKYLQLSNAIIEAISKRTLTKDYLLPSINDLSYELDVSRDTAEKAYRHLKQLGIIGSVPGKGYYITKTDYQQRIKILLLFNKLSAHKKLIYDAFAAMLGENVVIDFYIYNNDFTVFKKLLEQKKEGYTHYVIIPHFLEGGEDVASLLNELKSGKLIILDKQVPGVRQAHSAIYENFAGDIYKALHQLLDRLSKYQTLKIIFPSYTYFPNEILQGFQRFCTDFAFNYKTISAIEEEEIEKGAVYINLMEDDLVVLLGKIKQTSMVVGKDVGIISYNETPWKEFILNGITTISTDFKAMGEMAATMVLAEENQMAEVPFHVRERESL